MPPQLFSISVPDADLDDLHQRLTRTRFAPPLTDTPSAAGVDGDSLRPLVEYWRDEFDWRAAESRLNAAPQFVADVDGQRVHFARLRAAGDPKAAVVLTHGWPYSFVEMLRLATLLTDCDVVVPSLPGFGFSAPFRTGPFTGRRVADLWCRLMVDSLGCARFLTYGEDVGGLVSDALAAAHPQHVAGLLATHAAFPPASRLGDLSAEESAFLDRLGREWADERGYSEIQRTKPDTLAASLVDSPAGLAAWMTEKLRTWSGGKESFTEAWSTDDVLSLVSLYWFTRSIGTSFAPYWSPDDVPDVVDVPVVVAVQHGERGYPRSLAERTYRDLRAFSTLPEGGHFTAFQTPELVAGELRRLIALTT